MRKIAKPSFDVKQIIYDCVSTYRSTTKKQRIKKYADYIQAKSVEYDSLAITASLSSIPCNCDINGNDFKDDMISLYEDKFAKNSDLREKYYDKLIVAAPGGVCPICGLGQVGNLDHYLPKSL